MPCSNIQPIQIFIDRVEAGVATILVRWDIVETTKTNEMGDTYSEWSYSEKRLEWTLPQVFASLGEVQTYLDSIYDSGDIANGQIVNWAKASKVTFNGGE